MLDSDSLPGVLGVQGVSQPQNSPFFTAVIASVDPERWTCDVQIDQTGQTQTDIPIVSPYFFSERGQGLYVIPEAGSRCVVVESYGTFIILGFLPPVDVPQVTEKITTRQTEDLDKDYVSGAQLGEPTENENLAQMSYRSNREGDMLPGDACLKTRAGNKVKLFSNGNILVEATKLCSRIYSKLEHWILDICVNWLIRTPGGEVKWTNDISTNESNYEMKLKSKVDDSHASYHESIGSKAGVYKRSVNDKDSGDEMFSEHIAADGTVTIVTEAASDETVGDTKTILVENDINVTSTNGELTITTPDGTIVMGSGNIEINSLGNITLTAAGNITLDPGGSLILAP